MNTEKIMELKKFLNFKSFSILSLVSFGIMVLYYIFQSHNNFLRIPVIPFASNLTVTSFDSISTDTSKVSILITRIKTMTQSLSSTKISLSSTSSIEMSSILPTRSANKNLQSSQKYNQINSILQSYKLEDVDCKRLFDGDQNYIKEITDLTNTHKYKKTSDEEIYSVTKDCNLYSKSFVTEIPIFEDANFPLGIQILVFKDAEQFEILLKAIYRPQHEYCIHVDKKSNAVFRRAIESIANCFDNIQVISNDESIDVQWGYFSVLEPEIVCMHNLWKRRRKWKYLINLTGQEYPLHSMQRIVEILKNFNGSNSLEGTLARRNLERLHLDIKGRPKQIFGKNMTLSKGAIHIAVQRGFVDYVLNNNTGIEFLNWMKDVFHPDETFFSSLNHSPQLGIPGSYKGIPETDPYTYPFITRFKNWGNYPFDYPCAGQRVRMICIFSVGDLQLLAKRPELFANKFYIDYQPVTLQCMRELIYNRTRDDYLIGSNITLALNYYKTLPFVLNHV